MHALKRFWVFFDLYIHTLISHHFGTGRMVGYLETRRDVCIEAVLDFLRLVHTYTH